MVTHITAAFDLDEDTRERLSFRYLDHKANGNRAWKVFNR